MEDSGVLDGAGDGVRVLKMPQGSFTESFIKIRNIVKTLKFPPSHFLESWNRNIVNTLKFLKSSKSFPGVLEDSDVLDGAGDGVRVLKTSLGSFTESFIKIQHQEPCQDSKYPPSHFLESWRTVMFLMELEMVSGYSKHPWEALLKVSSRSNIRNLVKTLNILQVISWSLGGQ